MKNELIYYKKHTQSAVIFLYYVYSCTDEWSCETLDHHEYDTGYDDGKAVENGEKMLEWWNVKETEKIGQWVATEVQSYSGIK